jgi:hypothetical protein
VAGTDVGLIADTVRTPSGANRCFTLRRGRTGGFKIMLRGVVDLDAA